MPTGWSSSRYTLFLRVHSAENLQLSTSLESYCKLHLGEKPVVNSSVSHILSSDRALREGDAEQRIFVTRVAKSDHKTSALWNQKFEIPVEDPHKETLSIRVKSQHHVYCPSIGACAIELKQLRVGQTVDQVFPLLKAASQVGAIRLQLMVRENHDEATGSIPMARRVMSCQELVTTTAKKRPKQLQPQQQQRLLQYHEQPEETNQHALVAAARHRESLLALECERLRIEEEQEARERKQRERAHRLALEKQRIEAEMQELRRQEEETRKRLQQEAQDKERQRLRREQAEKNLAAELEEIRARRQWQKDEDELAKQEPQCTRSSTTMDNQADVVLGFPLAAVDETTSKKKPRRPGRRQSAVSLKQLLDQVVQPSSDSEHGQSSAPSESEEDELDTDDEQEVIRTIAKLSMQLKRRKKQAHDSKIAARPAYQEPEAAVEAKQPGQQQQQQQLVVYHHHYESEESSEEDEEEQQLQPIRRQSHYRHSCSSPAPHSDMPLALVAMPTRKEKRSKSHGDLDLAVRSRAMGSQQLYYPSTSGDGGMIRSLTPNELTEKTGKIQSDALSCDQVCQAAVSIAVLAAQEDGGDEGMLPAAVKAIHSMAPIGRFVGRKLHEATAKVSQLSHK